MSTVFHLKLRICLNFSQNQPLEKCIIMSYPRNKYHIYQCQSHLWYAYKCVLYFTTSSAPSSMSRKISHSKRLTGLSTLPASLLHHFKKTWLLHTFCFLFFHNVGKKYVLNKVEPCFENECKTVEAHSLRVRQFIWQVWYKAADFTKYHLLKPILCVYDTLGTRLSGSWFESRASLR